MKFICSACIVVSFTFAVKGQGDGSKLFFDKYYQTLKYKITKVCNAKDNYVYTIGTGFFIKKKNNFYLATNYLIATGREATDTSLLVGKELPNKILVYFLKGNMYIAKLFDIYDSKGNYKFKVIPKIKGLPASTREVTDLIFFPIPKDSFPSDCKIDTINIFDNYNYKCNTKNDVVYVLGYRQDANFKNIYPRCDVTTTITQAYLPTYNNFFYFMSKNNLLGDSGAPMFFVQNNKLKFIGIHCAGISGSDVSKDYPNINVNKSISNSAVRRTAKQFIQ